jgi:hypothetical protein
MRTMLTRDIAALLPFNVQELNEKSGVCYGINQVSHNLCIGNRKKLANGNGMVFGVPGSGKSYFSKSEMLQVFLGTDDDIICIDPTLEYFDIAEALGNQAAIINLSTYTKNYINPLEMDVWALDLNDSQGYIRDKGEFMLGLCEQCYGDNLNSRHKSIIDRCVRKLYIDIAKAREKHIPTMSEFYELLLEQPEEEAKDIALSLELFVNGSLNIFNNHTNVNVQARFVVYGTRDLGKELGAISTLVMLENISARIAENAKESIRVLKEKLADVLENRSERNRWISHFTQFSTMETLDRKAVVHMIQSIKVIGKKELEITFTYQDEYQKAIQLIQLAEQTSQRKVG